MGFTWGDDLVITQQPSHLQTKNLRTKEPKLSHTLPTLGWGASFPIARHAAVPLSQMGGQFSEIAQKSFYVFTYLQKNTEEPPSLCC